MKWALVWLFGLFLVKNSQSSGFEFGLDTVEEDKCEYVYETFCSEQNTYHDHECSDVCHHKEFKEFLTTAPKIGKFKKCCDMYSFENLCQDEEKGASWNYWKNNPRLCGAQGNISTMNFECPEGCKAYYGVNGEELDLNATQGTVDLKVGQKRLASINDSCATYECKRSEDDYSSYYDDEDNGEPSEIEGGYKMVFHICVCPKKEALKEDIETNFQDPRIKQCCPNTYFTVLDTKDVNEKTLECPGGQESQPNQDLRTCQESSFKQEEWQPQMINDTHFTLTHFTFKNNKTKDFKLESEQFCIGQTQKKFGPTEGFSSDPDLFHHTLFHCPNPCTEGKPCLRKCCEDHKMGNLCIGSEANPDNYTMWKNLDPDVKTYAIFQTISGRGIKFLSQSKCSQQFDLVRYGSEVLLKMTRTIKVYQPHEFCVNFHSDGTLGAAVVRNLEDQCADDDDVFWQEMNAKFEGQNVEMTKQFENLVERFEQFLESKFEEQARRLE